MAGAAGAAVKRSKGSASGSAAADATPGGSLAGGSSRQRKQGAEGESGAEAGDLEDSDGDTFDANGGGGVLADSPVTALDRIGKGKAQALEALNINECVLSLATVFPLLVFCSLLAVA